MSVILATYSFLDFLTALNGPFGTIDFSDCGIAEEGISIEFDEDKATKTMGADGSCMYSLHAGTPGAVIIRLLKTSPRNATMSRLYAFDTAASANYGRNTITGRNTNIGDKFTCIQCGIQRHPNNVNSKVGAMQEWRFHVGRIVPVLGDGNPALRVNGGV